MGLEDSPQTHFTNSFERTFIIEEKQLSSRLKKVLLDRGDNE
jgi:hypothetical protein